MASYFSRPTWERTNGFVAKQPHGLAYVYLAKGGTRDIVLSGGSGLTVNFNDYQSASARASCVESRAASTQYRFFTLSGRTLGSCMLEARSSDGRVQDFVQVIVDEPISWGAKVSHPFKAKVVEICARQKIVPDYLMACMAFETGRTFSPSIKNTTSGAVGLIQFMSATAAVLHTNSGVLATLSAVAQLDYVEQYLAIRIRSYGFLRSLEDVYMSILWPKAIGQPDTYVLFDSGAAYRQNAGLDLDKDGAVTKWEATNGVRKLFWEGQQSTLYG